MMKIMFVCTGNTCRSPMAEAVLKDKLEKLNIKDVFVDSSGINCVEGFDISDNAKTALKQELDIDFTHRSKRITREDCFSSDYIICMTRAHKGMLQNVVDSSRLFTFDDFAKCGDVIDPYCRDLNEYVKTLNQIRDAMDFVVMEITKNI